MAQGTVTAKWVEGGMFVGVDSRGYPIVVGISNDHGSKWMGAKASDLLLLGVATCSGVDVADILRKQRQPLTTLEVQVTGNQDDEPPWKFTKIHIEYLVRGKNLNEALVKRAIELSEEKYCSVIASVRPHVDITTQYRIEEV